MIRTIGDLAEFTAAQVAAFGDDVRAAIRDRLLIREVDGSDVVERVRERWPALPSSFLGVVARWSVLGKSFTGFIVIDTEAKLGLGSFGLDEAEFAAIASNGSGDPIGVVPEGATSEPVGSIAHFNHDTGRLVIVAPDFETFLVGLGNYGECWNAEDDEPEIAAGAECEQRLVELGWSEEFRRYWPRRNENGCFV